MNTTLLQHRIAQIVKDGENENEQNSRHILCYLNDKIAPVIQDGPQCGLVALHMALQQYNCEHGATVANIFDRAKEMKMTQNGEMFSARSLAHLSEVVSNGDCNARVVTSFPDAQSLCLSLLSDTSILVPYDSDKNFEPTCLNGHAAHWALLVGFLLVASSPIRIEPRCTDIRWLDNTSEAAQTEVISVGDRLSRCCLLALHGKSRHAAVWSYDRLKESNGNLNELGPKRISDGRTYVLPDSTVRAGLCEQMVLLRPARVGGS